MKQHIAVIGAGLSGLRTKLALMLAVPILGILFITGSQIVDKLGTSSDMSNMQQLVTLSTKMNWVLHESQKERGRTGLFLGSNGENWSKELSDQRALLNSRIDELNEFLSGFDSSKFGTEFQAELRAAEADIAGFPAHRRAVDSLSISGKVGIGYYSATNAQILEIASFTARLTDDRELADRIHAYVNFDQAKEKMGRTKQYRGKDGRFIGSAMGMPGPDED